jgi:hypothetical protein
MAVLSKLRIAYIHLRDSSKKDDYLSTITLSHVSSVTWDGQARFRPTEVGFRSHSRQTICFLIPNYTTVTRNPKQLNPIMNKSSGTEAPALMTLCANLTPIKWLEKCSQCGTPNADRFTSHTIPPKVAGTSQNGVNLSLKDSGERSKSERCLEIKSLRKKLQYPPCSQTRSHQYRILSHRKDALLQFQIAISP